MELLWQKGALLFARRITQGRRQVSCYSLNHVRISKRTEVSSEQAREGVPAVRLASPTKRVGLWLLVVVDQMRCCPHILGQMTTPDPSDDCLNGFSRCGLARASMSVSGLPAYGWRCEFSPAALVACRPLPLFQHHGPLSPWNQKSSKAFLL